MGYVLVLLVRLLTTNLIALLECRVIISNGGKRKNEESELKQKKNNYTTNHIKLTSRSQTGDRWKGES